MLLLEHSLEGELVMNQKISQYIIFNLSSNKKNRSVYVRELCVYRSLPNHYCHWNPIY